VASGLAGCGSDTPPNEVARSATPLATDAGTLEGARAKLVEVAEVSGPATGLATRPDDPATYIVEREGRVLRRGPGGTTTTLLDLRSKVTTDGEGGAFDAAFTTDDRALLVSYADKETYELHVVRLALDDQGAVTGSPTTLVTIGDGTKIHNAGKIEVSADGTLLVSVGDGGELNEAAGRARTPDSIRGRILAYSGLGQSDADPASADEPRTVAFGLRNPWRFFTDPVSGSTWIGDVGQSRWEEIDLLEPSDDGDPVDFGWDLTEGYQRSRGLPPDGMRFPVAVVHHDGDHCAIVGGPVMRDQALPELAGSLVVGDYCSSSIRFIRMEQGKPAEVRTLALPSGAKTVSFAVGSENEVYVLRTDGVISRIDPGGRPLAEDDAPLITGGSPTFEGDEAICGLPAAAAAYPAMQGKPPAEVRQLAADLSAALAAYRAAELPPDLADAFATLDEGLSNYLVALQGAGWDTQASSVALSADALLEGPEAYRLINEREGELCG